VQRRGMEGFLALADRPAVVGAARSMIAAGRCHALGVGGNKAILRDSSASAARRSTASRLCRRVLQDRRPGLSRRAASYPCRDDLLTLAARSSRPLPSEAFRRRRFQTARPIQFRLALRADPRFRATCFRVRHFRGCRDGILPRAAGCPRATVKCNTGRRSGPGPQAARAFRTGRSRGSSAAPVDDRPGAVVQQGEEGSPAPSGARDGDEAALRRRPRGRRHRRCGAWSASCREGADSGPCGYPSGRRRKRCRELAAGRSTRSWAAATAGADLGDGPCLEAGSVAARGQEDFGGGG